MAARGAATAHARAARPGAALWFVRPKASTVWHDDVDWALLAGDETALPAFRRFLAERPVDAPVQGVLAVGHAPAPPALPLHARATARSLVAPAGAPRPPREPGRRTPWRTAPR
ncbi:SIP domain-containing protein, partial [Cellulosimicrobium sp. MI9406]|uniref:SIP domain-containing protein n=1 Tax=Cellulosimicrobium sp. MI9406 TaxID=2931398 RepID=UPI0033B81FCB